VIGEDEQRAEARWTGEVRFVPEHLADPIRWRKPRQIFVNSMSDLFHEKLTNEQIAAVFGVMAACPRHTFQCLTKRPIRMREFLTHPEVRHWIAKAKDAALVERDHDPRERWEGIPDLPLYEASSHGNIRNRRTTIQLQPQLNEHEQIGRYTITVYDDGEPTTQFVHRLVLRAFAGKPNFGEEGCHRNGNKTDNRIANLRWGTRSDNQKEKVRHGARGGPAKLTLEQVAQIRKRRASGDTQQVIADAYGVSRSLVSMIENGDVWAEPDIPWPLPNVHLGVSVENQAAADERIPELLATPAAVRFLSCEPLLGEIDLSRWLGAGDGDAPFWIIAGCESGPGARPCDVTWLRSLRDQCAAAGVPFFLKQATEDNRALRPLTARADLDARCAISFGPGSKQKSGGVIELPYLDGVQHAAFPSVTQ